MTNPPGQLLTGLLLERYGTMPTILIGWIILILVALAMTLYKPLRTAHDSNLVAKTGTIGE